MENVKIIKKPRYWGVAEVFLNEEKIKTINKYYKVTEDFIIEYEAVGGCDSISKSDNVIWKYYIGDKNLEIK